MILFLTDREDGSQVWGMPTDGGEARRLTAVSTGVADFKCSPSNDEIAFVSRVFSDCESDSCNQARLDEQDENPLKARLYEKLMYRRYGGWIDGRINRLFVSNFEKNEVKALFSNSFDAPTTYLSGYYGGFSFGPDGRELCFAMSVDSTPAIRVNNDLYVVIPGGSPERITDNPALDGSPRYSPDGRYISHHAMKRAGYEADQNDLVLYDRSTKINQNVTVHFDLSVGEYVWGPNAERLYFTAINHGFSMVWQLDLAVGTPRCLLDDAVYRDLKISPDGQYLIVNRSLSDEPYELHRYDIKSGRMTRLTHFTQDIVTGLDMNRAEEFWFTGAMGDSVHGFLTRPPGFDPGQSYPLVLLVHGGPQWCWLGDFNYYGWNTQLTAAQGYIVAQIDPHGSVGYGVEFKDYISGHWCIGDYEDLMMGVDYLVATISSIDSTRMAVLGRSYGGTMVDWICGHTDRFSCLITIDGGCNKISSYGTTDELWFPEWEFNGTPWSNPDEYVRASPIAYAANFVTPTMVIHGQKDYRVSLGEGLQMFTALQRMGVPSQLLVFPDEGHAVGKLKNLRYVYEKQFEWLERWLGE
jgi:dipeptidyl aminopeptidase/acylaminoacyl peptidase